MSNTPITPNKKELYVGNNLPTADKYISPFRFGPTDIKIGNDLQDYSGVFKDNNTKYNDLRLGGEYLCLPEATQAAFPWGTVVNVPLSNWKLGEDGSTDIHYIDLAGLPTAANYKLFCATQIHADKYSSGQMPDWNDNYWNDNCFQVNFLNNNYEDCSWEDKEHKLHKTTIQADMLENITGLRAGWKKLKQDEKTDKYYKYEAGPIYEIKNGSVSSFNITFDRAIPDTVERRASIEHDDWSSDTPYLQLPWIFNVKKSESTEHHKFTPKTKYIAMGLQGQGGRGGDTDVWDGLGGGGGGFIGGILNTTGKTWYIFGGANVYGGGYCSIGSDVFGLDTAYQYTNAGTPMVCVDLTSANFDEQMLTLAYMLAQIKHPYAGGNNYNYDAHQPKNKFIIDSLISASNYAIIAAGGGGAPGSASNARSYDTGGAGGGHAYTNSITTDKMFWPTTLINGGNGNKIYDNGGNGKNVNQWTFKAYMGNSELINFQTGFNYQKGGKNGGVAGYSGGGGASALGPGGNGGGFCQDGHSPESGYGGGGGGGRWTPYFKNGAYGADGCWILFY